MKIINYDMFIESINGWLFTVEDIDDKDAIAISLLLNNVLDIAEDCAENIVESDFDLEEKFDSMTNEERAKVNDIMDKLLARTEALLGKADIILQE